MLSLVIPVYLNSENIADLIAAGKRIHRDLPDLELVFVVDGSPDDSGRQLAARLPDASFPAQLIVLSRNFGTFAAIRAGLAAGRGDTFAIMSADLQEPPDLIVEFERLLAKGDHDLVVGARTSRQDPLLTRTFSWIYWTLYRRFVQPELPEGGVDVFACSRRVRDHLLRFHENPNSFIGLLFWVGFRRAVVPYARRKRARGRSAWSFAKRAAYLADSVFAFSDLPIRALLWLGIIGIVTSVTLATVVLAAKLAGEINVPGYTATVLTVTFFGGLNCAGLGIIGAYVWRTYQTTIARPDALIATHDVFAGVSRPAAVEPHPLRSAAP